MRKGKQAEQKQNCERNYHGPIDGVAWGNAKKKGITECFSQNYIKC